MRLAQRMGSYHFKMNEMAAGHMDRVSAFYRIIENNVLMSLFWKVDIAEATRAKDRMWVNNGSIDWRFMNNIHGLAFRCLMDIFHAGRSRPGPINELLPPDKQVDFYFDNHSSKGAIIDAWEDYMVGRPDDVRGLYGATPRLEVRSGLLTVASGRLLGVVDKKILREVEACVRFWLVTLGRGEARR